MKHLILAATAMALIPVGASAQLLGGGGTGSIGGTIGGVGGTATGTATTTVTRSSSATRIATATRQQVRAPEVATPEVPEVPSTPQVPGSVDAAGNASGNLTTSAGSVATAAQGSANVSGEMLEAAGAANGNLAIVEVAGMARGATDAVTVPSAEAVAVPAAGVRAVAVPTIAVPAPQAAFVSVPVTIANVPARRAAFVSGGVAPIARTQVTTYVDTQYRTIERDLAGTGATVQRRGDQIIIDMPSDVTFAFDKSDIRPRFHGVLNALSGTLSQYPATFVDIIGHTDSKGSDAYNMALSERRAMSVASYLSARSTNRARLYTEGRGEFEPIDSNATVEGRAANRRVEIILTPYAA